MTNKISDFLKVFGFVSGSMVLCYLVYAIWHYLTDPYFFMVDFNFMLYLTSGLVRVVPIIIILSLIFSFPYACKIPTALAGVILTIIIAVFFLWDKNGYIMLALLESSPFLLGVVIFGFIARAIKMHYQKKIFSSIE